MTRRTLRIAGAVGLVVAASALLGRVRPSTYDAAWSRLPASADSLDGREIALTGYALPLSGRRHVLLTAFPPGCPFCRPGPNASAVEVFARADVPAGDHPVVARGTLRVRPEAAPRLALTDAAVRPAP